MAAPTETYVDPAIAANSGTGTIGDPYGDLQYALNTMTRNATNGDRINIKAGTDEILSAALVIAADYGTPTAAAPLIFQGYTSAAGDGGIGGISGGGTVGVYTEAINFVRFRDLHCHNTGSVDILKFGQLGNAAENVELNNTTGDGIDANTMLGGPISHCYFHDIQAAGVNCSNTGANAEIRYCHFANGTKDFDAAIILNRACTAENNTFNLDGASDGIRCSDRFGVINGNSILSSSGTGKGLELSGSGGNEGIIINNVIEGFSGSGGVGISITGDVPFYGYNAVYNCATAYDVAIDIAIALGDNETLGATPFTKSGANTWANRFTYYEPVDTGNIQGGAYPAGCRRDKGAVQHADPAGGAGGGRLVNGGLVN